MSHDWFCKWRAVDRSVKAEVQVLPFFHVLDSHAHTCGAGCDNKTKPSLLFLWIQRCSTGLQEGNVIFTTLKASLRTEFERHICENLGSLNSQVCMQRLESQRERETVIGDLDQLPHWVFFGLFM